jgi:hypothetical protein
MLAGFFDELHRHIPLVYTFSQPLLCLGDMEEKQT